MLSVLVTAVLLAAPFTGAVGVEAPTVAIGSATVAQAANQNQLVDINSAGPEELEAVPGIGATLARRIIEFRTEHGPYEKLDDLLNVQGIGVASLAKLRPFLTVKPKK